MLAPIGGYRDDIDVLVEVERARQDLKWGEQNHPDGTGAYYTSELEATRADNEGAVKHDKLDWSLILLEEVYEALVETDPTAIKTELIQVMAVCKAWIECNERRSK